MGIGAQGKSLFFYKEKHGQTSYVFIWNVYVNTWQCLPCTRHNDYVIPGYHHIFLPKTMIFDIFLPISRSGTITVASGIIFSFRTHPVSSRNTWSWHMFDHCFGLIRFLQNFEKPFICHWFSCSGPSRDFSCPPRRPPRKISTDSPDLEFSDQSLMPYIYSQSCFVDKAGFFQLTKPCAPGYSTSSATQHRRLLNIIGYSTSSITRHHQPCPQSK
jgi:hypothetical protein